MYHNLDEVIPDSKDYKNIAERRNVSFSYLIDALDIVEKFIRRKKLILYGGMAIDISLKARDHDGIYTDDSIPDYDFMSSDSYNDSIELADILHKAGMPNISAINALHITTRRVRVNYISVADITHVPQVVLDQIPYVEWKGIRVVHPDFQRCDMHRAFSTPYEHAPNELVYFRSSKDMKRFHLLTTIYPISIESTDSIEIDFDLSKSIEVDMDMFHDSVIGGVLGYGILNTFIRMLINDKSIRKTIDDAGMGEIIDDLISQVFDIKINVKNGKFELTYLNNKNMNVCNRIACISENFISKASSIKGKPKYFNRYLDDIKPRSIEIETEKILWDIHDTRGRLLPALPLSKFINIMRKYLPHLWKTVKINDNIWIANIQNILMYMLARVFLSRQNGTADDEQWLYLYSSTEKIGIIAEKIIISLGMEKCEFWDTPYFLSANVYGKYNWDYQYQIMNVRLKAMISGEKYESIRPPHGYYPENNQPPQKFDETGSWIYHMDGVETEPFDEIEIR